MSFQGKFIVIEGIEGSGKSTLSKNLKAQLELLNQDIILTREPGGTKIGQNIRELILKDPPEGSTVDPLTELLLFFTDRAQHLQEIILPNLNAGKMVICDRFIHSTLAYQHYGRGLDKSVIDNLIEIVVQNTKPDLVILVDLDPNIALSRAKNRSSLDRIEKEDLTFHSKIRDGFLVLAKENLENFITLNGELPPEKLTELALNEIRARFIASS